MKGAANIRLQQTPFPSEGVASIFPVFEDTLAQDARLKSLYQTIKRRLFTGKEHQILVLETVANYESVVLVGLGKKQYFELKKLRESVAEGLKKIQHLMQTKVDVYLPKEAGDEYFEIGKHMALALSLTNYAFQKYKSQEDRKKHISVEDLTIYSESSLSGSIQKEFEHGVTFGLSIADSMNLTRDLVNEPASALDPEGMAAVAREIADQSHGTISVEVLDKKACEALGMGSYLAVAQGSERQPKFIVLKRESASRDAKKKRLCLVGKSIIFDTGGYSLKPAEHMMDMKIDMAGGATVLGIFSALSRWNEEISGQLDLDIYGVLPVCENMVSGKATRPGDIATAMNGKTIEILNTDAEGRLTLADGLVYAEKTLKSDYIIDLATLTGACMVALGKKIAGMFGDNDQFISAVESVAEKEGDEIWQLPLYKPYLEHMVSDIAELKNIGGGRYGGAITAALFLKQFVTKGAWIHIDIAGPAYNDEAAKGTTPKGGTGWGVLTLIELIRRWSDLMT